MGVGGLVVMLYPEPEKGGRGKKSERVAETATLFSATRLKQARAIFRYSVELAQSPSERARKGGKSGGRHHSKKASASLETKEAEKEFSDSLLSNAR